MQFLSKSNTTKSAHKSNFSIDKAFYTVTMFASIFALVLTPYALRPKTVNAGLFSFITDLGGDQVSAKTIDTSSTSNSQNMLLLEAAVNSDPNPHKTDTSSILAYNNALYAEIGPQGTVSDLENKVSSDIGLYTVREGDNLSKISDMFDVSVDTIIWANELGKNPIIEEGQTLVILPISGIKYTVKKGDTIKGIVYRYKANLDDVLQYNDLTLYSTINAGDVIVIPDAEPTVPSKSKISQVKKTSSDNKAHDTNGPFYPGYYIRPVQGSYESQGLHGYNAVDLAAPVGTPIHASAAGKVISSISNGGWNGGYGNFVIIAHSNGSQTLYAHTLKNYVKVGDNVEQGEMIAKIGMTGKTTGPHVHFEIRGAKNPF